MDVGFHCDRCRIWTGGSSNCIADVVTADETEFQTINTRIAVAFESRTRGIRLVVRDKGQQKRCVHVSEDTIRMIDIYSPSPFSMAIIVQIDVSETTQQCFFLSHLSSNTTNGEANSEAVLRVNDRMQVLDSLTALHKHLRDVPLTAAARELLANETTQGSKPNMLKRRRTATSSSFYGRTAQSPHTPKVTASHDDTAVAASWTSFYERLQFNVSHSLLCQLEGTAPLSSSFPRQQEAFEFADQVTAFRKRLANQQRHQQQPQHPMADPPRVFCFEGANEGKRRFWVTTMSAFWKQYTAIPHGSRHVYEIIRERVPCRLYFDLEFKKPLNPRLDGDTLVERLVSLVQLQLYRQYHFVIDREKHVVQLKSSTKEKFSRHLTIHMPNGELFADNIHVGAVRFSTYFVLQLLTRSPKTHKVLCQFVRQLIHELVASDRDDTASQFLVRDSPDDNDQRQFFIDVGVYTRNRMFRVLGSSKYRKPAVLRALPAGSAVQDEHCNGDSLDYDLFLRSIVCPHQTADTSETTRLLRCEDTVSLKRYGISGPLSHNGAFHPSMRSVESKSSMFPALDAFIRSIATTGGIQGEIRAVNLLYPTAPIPTQEQVVDNTATTDGLLLNEPVRIVYHMMKNRWCENISRPHKSNNVMFVVDLTIRQFFQRCHDPHCHAMDYRSPPRPLPRDLVLESKVS